MKTRQIFEALKRRCRNFGGVFACDRIPRRMTPRRWIVVNLDPSYMKGSHWVVLGKGEYFDPLGLPPKNRDVLDALRRDRRFWVNSMPLQSALTTVCGHYCIYYILMRCRNVSPTKIVTKLANMHDPDLYVYKHVNKMY